MAGSATAEGFLDGSCRAFVFALAAGLGLGCGARPTPAPGVPAATPGAEAATSVGTTLAPLTERERKLEAELRRDVEQLSKEIGERNTDKKWELASAADYIANELENAGYSLDRQGFEVGEVLAQNLGVELPGGDLGNEIVVVGAHYDSAPGTPGADDNASGAAALLALARGLSRSRHARTLRLVAFANAEPPYFRTPQMGSLVWAKRAAARGEKIVAMISIDSIGYFSDAANSQRRHAQGAADYPSTGDFIAVEGNPASKELVMRLRGALDQHASLPALGAALPDASDETGTSDHWSFWQVGYPAVILTDTAKLRYPQYHRADDTPDKLDFSRMARVVAGLEGALEVLLANDKKVVQASCSDCCAGRRELCCADDAGKTEAQSIGQRQRAH